MKILKKIGKVIFFFLLTYALIDIITKIGVDFFKKFIIEVYTNNLINDKNLNQYLINIFCNSIIYLLNLGNVFSLQISLVLNLLGNVWYFFDKKRIKII